VSGLTYAILLARVPYYQLSTASTLTFLNLPSTLSAVWCKQRKHSVRPEMLQPISTTDRRPGEGGWDPAKAGTTEISGSAPTF